MALDKKLREENLKRLKEHLKKRPTISDKDFMKETEVTPEQYKQGIGFTLPGTKE